MARLIDADALLNEIKIMWVDEKGKVDFNELSYAVRKQPTAYDVDAVVEELESKLTCEDSGSCGYCQNRWCPMQLLDADDVIEIVRKGGVNE